VAFVGDMTTAGGAITLSGFEYAGTLDAEGGDVSVAHSITPEFGTSAPYYSVGVTIDSPSSTVYAYNCLIDTVLDCSTIHLIDSRVLTAGISADTIICSDVWSGPPVLPTAPSSPAEGQIYFNSTSKHFFGYDGTTFKQLDN